MKNAEEKPQEVDRKRYTLNVGLIIAAGLSGFLTVAILFVALFFGLWLDNIVLQNERNIFTVFLLIVSVPFTLLAMLWVVRFTTSRLRSSTKAQEGDQEEADLG
ncbi:MAG: hypothetical protein DWQ07_24680 [Chloroflexi bacterium]|nr:MAG: hypothetical protein DWQ07_24680 [Chloroflexota bacterium]MBL1197112.1 hypothetical protein [Chloroflexota bacterium]NOH14407.1 hypothetical protein [Chloroflexota bacterium]